MTIEYMLSTLLLFFFSNDNCSVDVDTCKGVVVVANLRDELRFAHEDVHAELLWRSLRFHANRHIARTTALSSSLLVSLSLSLSLISLWLNHIRARSAPPNRDEIFRREFSARAP